jgi:transposase-like protein
VEELERGKYASIGEARRVYGIRGMGTIERWLRQQGRDELLPKRIEVKSVKEQDELKAARKRIRELEAAVADLHVDYCLERAYLEVACERMGEDAEGFKKKHAMTLSAARRRGG